MQAPPQPNHQRHYSKSSPKIVRFAYLYLLRVLRVSWHYKNSIPFTKTVLVGAFKSCVAVEQRFFEPLPAVEPPCESGYRDTFLFASVNEIQLCIEIELASFHTRGNSDWASC